MKDSFYLIIHNGDKCVRFGRIRDLCGADFEAIRFGSVSARIDPRELQAVYGIMEAIGNGSARSIPDVCDANGC